MNKSAFTCEQLLKLLKEQGPLTGKELLLKINMSEFDIWKMCNSCEGVITKAVGKRYLRLDKQVEGYARLSPSIIREFYGYTIIGTERDLEEISKKAEVLQQEIKEISQKKFSLAQEIARKIAASQKDEQLINASACFIIAGDVVYDMSHLEPRPESSTGELVKGSDLDIIVITEGLPEHMIKALDLTIYEQKNYLLKNPSYNEEIDYIIKDITKVKSQLKFDSFEAMVASKILNEGQFLYGNTTVFQKVKNMLIEAGIPEKIAALEEKALINRNNAVSFLLKYEGALSEKEYSELFYTKEEKEEFF